MHAWSCSRSASCVDATHNEANATCRSLSMACTKCQVDSATNQMTCHPCLPNIAMSTTLMPTSPCEHTSVIQYARSISSMAIVLGCATFGSATNVMAAHFSHIIIVVHVGYRASLLLEAELLLVHSARPAGSPDLTSLLPPYTSPLNCD